MKKIKNINPAIGPFITVLILLAILVFMGYIWDNIRHSQIFAVKEITVKGASADLSYLKGRNVFDINLKDESGRILRSYADYSSIRLSKVLPNRIYVEFIERRPLGLVKLYRYFAVDDSGTLFDVPGPRDAKPAWPVITGVETKLFGPKAGVKYNIKELNLALEILKQARKSHLLEYYSIRRVDVSNPANAFLLIPLGETRGDLEVRLGQNNIATKMSVLAGLAINRKNDISGIKYIDLRFNEPVIKLNEIKSK